MNGRKYPPVKIMLSPKSYNSLMSLLETFSIICDDEDYFKITSNTIFEKIEKYARIINEDESEFVQICFFENEASFLMELLIFEISIYTENTIDYFNQLAERKSKN